ncbi:MAG: cadherin repeat domain-containing protein [Kiloniellales bacterium]
MALDTRDKRASALLAGLRGGLLPLADGVVDQADRQQLSTLYRGVLAQLQDDADVRASIIGLGLPFGFPLPSPAGALSQRDRQQTANCYRGIPAQTVSVADRRASMLGLGLPFGFPLPEPAGAVSQTDRQLLAYSYAGILAGAASGGITDAILSGNEVVELADNGTVVGTVIPFGGGSPLSFVLTNDAGGAFAIDAATGVVTVANGSLLDFEASPADKSITVQISDGGTPFSKSFTIIVLDAAGPSDIIMDNQSVPAFSPDGTLVGTASGVGGIPPYSYDFAPGGNPSSLFAIDSATGEVTVAHGSPLEGMSSPSPQITIRVTDSEGKSFAKSFTINVSNVIVAAGGTPDDVEAALAQVTEHDAIIIIPGTTAIWARGITIPANFPFRVHIRGANWTPASTLYLTAATEAQAFAALEDFEPATHITTVGSGVGDGITLITINRPGCTVSRIWFTGRGNPNQTTQNDRAILLNDMEDQVVYYNRFEDLKSFSIACSGVPDRTLITDNVFSVNLQPGVVNASLGILSGVLISYTNTTSVYATIDYDSIMGTFAQPYVQRNLLISPYHAVDFTRTGYGVFRNNIICTGAGTYSIVRLHGRWLTASGATVPSARGAEIYDNVMFRRGGTNPWRFIDFKGGDFVILDNAVTTAGNFAQMSPETVGRNPKPPNLTCAQLPFPGNDFTGLTRKANLVGNTFAGNPVTASSGHIEGVCASVNQLEAGGMQQDGDIFFGAKAGYSKAGAHPLFPSDITS